MTIKHVLSTIGLVYFLFLAVGTTEDSGSSKNRDACNLDGCDKTADGWQYDYSGSQGGYGQSCYRTTNAANNKWGYCSKHHCSKDKVGGY